VEWLNTLEQLITDHKIPVGVAGEWIVSWLNDNLGWAFDAFSDTLESNMQGAIDFLNGVHPIIFIALAAALGLVIHRTWQIVVIVIVGLLFVLNVGLWEEMIATLVLTVYSTAVSLLIGIPIGIWATRRKWIYPAIAPILDLMQVIPTFVYLIPALILFHIGLVPGLVATVIFALPVPIRMTYLGISQVNSALVEAGESFGCTRWQLLAKVKLPAALPTIMAGVTQCIMLCLSMVVIAAMVGADGLGVPVMRSLGQYNVPMGVEAGLACVALAIILDRVARRPNRDPRAKRG
jgi:glycine betaine/proline transport system permease protein